MNEMSQDQNFEPGTCLEQPSERFFSSAEVFRMLLAALDLGWQVQEPVYLRPRWSEGGNWVFHFILQQKALSRPCLITAPWNPELEGFIIQEGWQVDRLPGREPASMRDERKSAAQRH